MLNSISDAIISMDREGYIQYVNSAVTEITGYTERDLLNRHISILYIDNDNTRAEYELDLVRKKGKFVSEGWKSRKDGTKYWGQLTLTILFNEENTFAGFTGVLVNTTERKSYELSLRQSEEQYRLMVEGVKDYAIFLLDEKGYIKTWNEGAKYIKGYNSNEIIGKHFSIFYTAEDLKDGKPERELRIAAETGKYEEQYWRVKKNGSLFWAHVVISALFNDQNKLIGFSKVTRDLTEKKESEESLRWSEERYRSLIEQVGDYAIFMMDEKGRIVSWNEGAKRINGYTADEIIGKYFSIFYPEEDIIKGKPAYELKIAREEGQYEEEGWRLRKDGSRFWASIVITPILNNQGILIGYSKVSRDLTEKIEAARTLKDSHNRYRSLAEELRKTNTELTYANQELEQFTSIVSHDLQEPIRTIKSFLQLIDMKLTDEQSADLKTYINKTIGAASRMRELIQNLLQYSQLSKGEIIKEKVKVKELVNQALQNLKGAVEASNADVKIYSDIETVYGNRIQLVQLMQNLLSNALKFTDGKRPEVKITAVQENGHPKFAVSDNGIGIDEGDLSKLFEIFRRLNTKKDYPGTGIGLAICKKIVDRHDGRIWPVSQPGKGTTFYFTLNEQKQTA